MRAGDPGAVVFLARGPRDVRLTGFTGFSEAPADVSNRGRTLLGIARFARWNAKSQDSHFKDLWEAEGTYYARRRTDCSAGHKTPPSSAGFCSPTKVGVAPPQRLRNGPPRTAQPPSCGAAEAAVLPGWRRHPE